MKTLSPLFVLLSALLLAFAAPTVRAQDPSGGDPNMAPPPLPPQDQYATGGDQGGPPPGQYQGAPPPDQGGDQGASFQQFYDQLGSQGTWVQTDNYGYVFQPAVTDPNWAPYSDGHWVYTDDGWTWVSDEPWGWATYHYGRWANIYGTGWVWVPGYRWAPAWVSWRYGGGYCGWAPLPPESFVGVEYGGSGGFLNAGFHFGGDVDLSFHIGAGCYNFVPVAYMGAPNYRSHYIPRANNYVVINNTTNITNINVGGPGRANNFRNVSVGGPSLALVNAHAQTAVQNVRLTATAQAGRSSLQGNSLAVYAPRVNAASVHQARPAQVSQTIAHPTFNRGDSISKPLAVTASIKPPAPSAEAIHAAEAAQQNAPSSAKIATIHSAAPKHLSKPLTSMQPVSEGRATTSATSTGGNGSNHSSTTTQNNTQNHTQHSTTSSPYTGETEKPYHPSTQTSPTPSYHPQQSAPTESHHTEQSEPAPSQTYHPQSQQGGNHQQAPSGGGQHQQGQPVQHIQGQQHPSAPPAGAAGAGNPGNPQNTSH